MTNNQTITSLFDQAIDFTDQKQIQLAIQCYDQIIRLQPNHAIAFNNMGILFNQIGQYQAAETCFDRASRIDSSYANAWYNWGNTLKDQEKFDLAIEKYKKAITCKNDFAEACNNMGDCLGKCNQLEQSISAFNQAISINPTLVGVYFNLGNLYYRNYQYQQALKYFQKCITIQPDYQDAHYHLSFTLLIMGDYLNGFKEYEWRLRRGPFTGDSYNKPFWDGKTATDKILFVYSEQGFGDNIHFCRYLSMIRGKVKRLIFGARTEQARLFQTISGVDQVIAQGDKLPQFDIHCSLLSLPYLFQTHTKTIPGNTPYLFPDILKQKTDIKETIEKQAGNKIRVGIVWGGNPDNKNDKFRSIPLETISKLFSISGIQWFSFQKGLHSNAIKQYESQLVDLSIFFNDFYDTAQGLCQMDLLISVDTSVAHLAGALGVPLWLLIPPQPDWRWLLERSDSPWYPACFIYRQNPDDKGWLNVIDHVYAALHEISSFAPNESAKAYFKDGIHQYQSQNYDTACIAFQKVLSTYPVSWEAEYNLSGLFAKKCNRHTAILYGQRAVRRQPKNTQIWQHLSNQYANFEDIDASIQCLRQAQKYSDFNHAGINYETGQLLLLNGQWREGLQWYEYRRQCNILPNRRKYDLPHWDGKPFKNKTLLLYSEFQDKSFVMYLRFAPMLKKFGGTVVLETTPGMYRLAMSTLQVDRIFYYPDNQDSESVDVFDIQASLESIPYLLNISEDAISHDTPYLQPDKQYIPLLSFIQSQALKLKIGITLFSEQADIITYFELLSQIMPVFQLDDISFFHIGHIPLSKIESIDIPENLIDLSGYLDDIHDVASAIAQMDVIISFDNMVGHVAGAMSKTVYMILPKRPNWYWQMYTNQSVWYPSMTLFREFAGHGFQALRDAVIEKRSQEHQQNEAPLIKIPNRSIYLHAIGFFDGLTGCHIHTRSFFDAITANMPVLESDIQLPKRLTMSVDYLNHTIMPGKNSVFNIAICPIHELDMLSTCPGVKIGYVVWESTSIPDDWMGALSHADYFWTPSKWFKQILINHGIESHAIKVIPEGVDGNIFTYKGPQLQSLNAINAYKFLYVGKFEERKATPEMLVTFDYTFKYIPNVCLILASQTYKKDFDFNGYMKDLGIRHPEKIIRVGPFARNSELAALYRSCDAFVMPTRAEGWGLPIIEAMACGLPVIVTGYSGLTEFATKENAYFIDYKMIDIEKPLGWQIKSNASYYGQWAEPDFLHLSDIMKHVWHNKDEAKQIGRKASHEIHTQWTWNHAAAKAIDTIRKLKKSL
jgi:tetratricopeptide (TPR) repeat protein/glycosyltransferase involved in cell wall biosynthesis